MKRGIYLLVCSIGLMLLAGTATQIFACTCGRRQEGVCEAMGTAKAVFIGEVIEADNTPYSISPAKRVPKNFVFKVKENFVGTEAGKTVEIYTGSGGGDCGYLFEKGKTYIVYAYETGGRLHTSICTHTRSIVNAAKEIDEMRALRQSGGAKIYGSVAFWAKLYVFRDSNQPLPKFNLTIEQTDGAREKYPLTTDDNGNYELTGLPAGKYRIVPSVPANMKIETSQTGEFTLNEKGCAKKDLYVKNDSLLTGRVVDGYEKAVADIPVDLIPAELMPPDFNFNISIYESITGRNSTNANGEFRYKSVPPGRYFLAANFNYLPDAQRPYPTTFYRAAGEKARATVIEISLGQKIENLVIQLPPPLATREIRGRVFWRFGRPAANVFVYIRDTANNQFISTARSDKDGNFRLQGFTGRKYVISAHNGRSFEILNFEFKAPETEFVLGDDTGEFKLVLEKNPDFKTN